jgi:hypothetical protein
MTTLGCAAGKRALPTGQGWESECGAMVWYGGDIRRGVREPGYKAQLTGYILDYRHCGKIRSGVMQQRL